MRFRALVCWLVLLIPVSINKIEEPVTLIPEQGRRELRLDAKRGFTDLLQEKGWGQRVIM